MVFAFSQMQLELIINAFIVQKRKIVSELLGCCFFLSLLEPHQHIYGHLFNIPYYFFSPVQSSLLIIRIYETFQELQLWEIDYLNYKLAYYQPTLNKKYFNAKPFCMYIISLIHNWLHKHNHIHFFTAWSRKHSLALL